MALASETEKGKNYILKEKALADHIGKVYNAIPVDLGDGTTSTDRLYIRDGKVVCIAEIKNGEMSLSDLNRLGTYIISYDKIDRGVALSSILHTPFFLFVYLIHSDDIARFKISDETGREVCNYTIEKTKTKYDCNGGMVMRENAYMAFDGMTIIKGNLNGAVTEHKERAGSEEDKV